MSIYFDITVALTKLCLLFFLAAWRLFYQCHSTKKIRRYTYGYAWLWAILRWLGHVNDLGQYYQFCYSFIYVTIYCFVFCHLLATQINTLSCGTIRTFAYFAPM